MDTRVRGKNHFLNIFYFTCHAISKIIFLIEKLHKYFYFLALVETSVSEGFLISEYATESVFDIFREKKREAQIVMIRFMTTNR